MKHALLSLLLPLALATKFSTVITTHGATVPTQTYPYNSEYWRQTNPGQLTGIGVKQAYLLGELLNLKYTKSKQILSETYSGEEILAQSSSSNAWLETAYGIMMGLFPIGFGLTINSMSLPPFPLSEETMVFAQGMIDTALPFGLQPVPVHSLGVHDDYMFRSIEICDKLSYVVKKVKESEDYLTYQETQQEFLKSISEKIGTEITKLEEIVELVNTIETDKTHEQSVPLESSEIQELRAISAYYNAVVYGSTSEQLDLSCSALFSDLKDYFLHASIGGNQPKLVSYTSNGTSLYSYVQCLGYTLIEPVLQSSLLELGLSDELVVTVSYNNEPIEMTCGKECTLDEFIKVLDSRIVNSIQKSCKIKD